MHQTTVCWLWFCMSRSRRHPTLREWLKSNVLPVAHMLLLKMRTPMVSAGRRFAALDHKETKEKRFALFRSPSTIECNQA